MTVRELALLLGGAALVSLLLSVLATPVMMRLATWLRYVDHPGGHKSHEQVTPYGGGVAIFLAAWLPLGTATLVVLLVPESWVAQRWGELSGAYAGGLMQRKTVAGVILLGGLALHVLGVWDDLWPRRPLMKLIFITFVALLTTVAPELRIAHAAGPALSITFTVLWIVVVTNAFNFLDNMDGLSAGVAAICLGFLIVCGVSSGQVFVPVLAAVFLGALAGFLVFNFPPARVFMGDAGSLVIGYMLAITSILTTYYASGQGGPPFPLAIPLVILAVPLYDATSVTILRLRSGGNPMRGDQRHFSHRLVQRGLDRRSAVLTIYLATLATGLASTLLPDADLGETLTVLAIVVMVLLIIAILEYPGRRGT
jgi:UDP-GlcNAc:undecaprenyl-phosphate GlcNAc-1-phosphate transferase